eukprot:TRINITY_DN1853_c0_g1_i3.p1 TRINITY_DN1853_c0_g1~~TRINITY_DN1853_c0_g1_i3.p1  ORF type:complete len:287 (+),score=59.55 TRINITY_DN1853_c0_g1_i3:67-927(+)
MENEQKKSARLQKKASQQAEAASQQSETAGQPNPQTTASLASSSAPSPLDPSASTSAGSSSSVSSLAKRKAPEETNDEIEEQLDNALFLEISKLMHSAKKGGDQRTQNQFIEDLAKVLVHCSATQPHLDSIVDVVGDDAFLSKAVRVAMECSDAHHRLQGHRGLKFDVWLAQNAKVLRSPAIAARASLEEWFGVVIQSGGGQFAGARPPSAPLKAVPPRISQPAVTVSGLNFLDLTSVAPSTSSSSSSSSSAPLAAAQGSPPSSNDEVEKKADSNSSEVRYFRMML